MEDFIPYLITVKPVKVAFREFKKIVLDKDQVTIGRYSGNTLNIDHTLVSRNHCLIKKSCNEWILKDFSSNGILVNNQIKNFHILKDGDLIQLDLYGDLLYKFISKSDDYTPPKSRRKLDATDLSKKIKGKYMELEKITSENLQMKIQYNKHLQTSSIILKEHLEIHMAQKMKQVNDNFNEQIENLNGRELKKEKAVLEARREKELLDIKQNIDNKIVEIMQQIEKLNENESELLEENDTIKEKLQEERDDFLFKLNDKSNSKNNLLTQIIENIKEQEQIKLQEKQNFEEQMRYQDTFNDAKDRSLEELEQKMLKERYLAEQKLQNEIEQLKKTNEEEKERLTKLLKAQEETVAKATVSLKAVDEAVETELRCSICAEILLRCTVLNCSHSFCTYCINKWTVKRNKCPMCRSDITAKCYNLALDSFIDKIAENQTEKIISNRQELLRERQRLEAESRIRRNYRRGRSRVLYDDDDDDDEERQEAIENVDVQSHISSLHLIPEPVDSE